MDNDEELLEYANLEGTEFGEYCILLCSISRYYYLSPDNLVKLIDEEKERLLSHFKENSKIVNRKEVRETTFQELEWTDESN